MAAAIVEDADEGIDHWTAYGNRIKLIRRSFDRIEAVHIDITPQVENAKRRTEVQNSWNCFVDRIVGVLEDDLVSAGRTKAVGIEA